MYNSNGEFVYTAKISGTDRVYIKELKDETPGEDDKCEINCDTDNDGVCDYNCDLDGDGVCDLNCDTNGDGVCDLNCDTNGDGICDTNCEDDKDDEDDKCEINCDTDNDGVCDYNCDLDGDGDCDLNCDTNGDGVCDLNCDTNGDGICDTNCESDTPTNPSTYLKGPIITGSPETELAETVKVSITTEEEAYKIYYKVGYYSTYKEYTGTFEVENNTLVRAYYIRASDGQVSQTSYYYVDNIKKKNMPYVKINTNPSNYLSEDVESVTVTITGSDYDTLEYSLDGVIYTTYTGPLTITESTTVYAKGTNKYGSTIVSKVITTVNPPSQMTELDVSIHFNPEKEEVTELIDIVSVTINYDTRATKKYYKIGYNGTWKEYTGAFDVTKNTTIYAYATNETGRGSTSRRISYLTTGISDPEIRISPTTSASYVKVTIEYDDNASVKKYKIGSGEWKDYTGAFYIDENTTIYAYNKNTLDDYAESQREITNIVAEPNYTILDLGQYYIIRLNYPSTSKFREYKWKVDGVWKEYDPQGILLIKNEYKDEIDASDGVKVKDENGKELIFTDHYYYVDVSWAEIRENIFMRWDTIKPGDPTIIVTPTEITKSVQVVITYPAELVEKYYKIVNPTTGEDSGWLEYTLPFTVTENNVIIYAKGKDLVDQTSNTVSKQITNIDNDLPIIKEVIAVQVGTSNIKIQVNATDETSSIVNYSYLLDGEEFTKTNESTYTFSGLKENTTYTIYVKVEDEAGNESEVYKLEITTKTMEDITFTVEPESGWAPSKKVTINYPGDEFNGYVYEYSLNGGETWTTYIEPLTIKENNTEIIARLIDGDNTKVSDTLLVTDIDPTVPTISLDEVPSQFANNEVYNLPTSYTDGPSGSTISCRLNGTETEYTTTKGMPLGNHTLKCVITTGAGLSASATKEIEVIGATIKGESILQIMEEHSELTTGHYTFQMINGQSEIYQVRMYVLEGNQTWTSNQTFGDANDVGASGEYAKNMIIVRVNGDLTINSGVTVTTYSNEYGGPKGFLLYVTGKLTNNGTITMTAKGAYAKGQNVYLWKNADGTYETVPAVGASGGATASSDGNPGVNGTGRATGGGGSGGKGASGGKGTSYSGGTGGGARGDAGSNVGGAGGNSSGTSRYAYGVTGVGNPAGTCTSDRYCKVSPNGTGGLLIIYADEYNNKGNISANGVTASLSGDEEYYGGGSSGGGSINIFTNQNTEVGQLGIATEGRKQEILGNVAIEGGESVISEMYDGGGGGAGTVNIGGIRNGQYYDLKDIIEQDKENLIVEGESILDILSDSNLESGYHIFRVNNEKYQVHLYVIEGNQTWTSNQTFGDVNDVSDGTNYSQNMVIVKVNGNLTINSGKTVTVYSNEYGGPKGFLLYVTGTLTNKGTVTMTAKGAYAEGQNVYLWKNADGTYEYVPAVGGAGGAASSSDGQAGTSGSGRATGGGGSGGSQKSVMSGAGGRGTSYSGGTGGGGAHSTNGGAGSNIGGIGGTGTFKSNSGGSSSGVGNPAGTCTHTRCTVSPNGTGGLLIIYAEEYSNNGTITANGVTATAASNYSGGSSGGGSINIFYGTSLKQGTVVANGGSTTSSTRDGGAGGAGTVTHTQITLATTNLSTSILSTEETTEELRNLTTAISSPEIKLDTTAITNAKEVSINYVDGYLNEYSLDLGETWNVYGGSTIKVEENTTILTRVVDGDDNVLSSSSLTITTIDNTEPSIELEIPESITVGEEYSLPTSSTGDTTVCTIDEVEYASTKDLSVGTYEIVCTVKNNNGKEKSITKTLQVKEKETTEEESGEVNE